VSYLAPLIPQNAPFTAAQVAWINGFLAALLAPGAAPAAAAPSAASSAAPAEDFPWHDPALGLEERLALSAGRPLARRLMSAMAQLDCGQCGYLCRSYGEALAGGAEKSLARCVPGGKATARALKELIAAAPAAPARAAAAPASPSPTKEPAAPGRTGPCEARLLAAARLNGPASEKDTRHVVIDLAGSGLDYVVGDSLGVHVANCPELVAQIVERLGATGEEAVACGDGATRSLQDALARFCDIGRPSDLAVEVLASRAVNREESEALQALAEGYPGAEPADADLLDLLLAFPSARPPLQELVEALDPLQPRLYSIASSPKATPGEVHLTVAAVRYKRRGRLRKGIASTYLADRVPAGGAFPVFVQSSRGFRLPEKGDAPVIMIGPGTGIAPFRAFLQERRAIGAGGRNWLFFGDQRRASDFLYEGELEAWRRDGLLTRLDTAFSRDQDMKVYVQHRMREQGAELWRWLQDGAHLYVCGDAQRMAKDVDAALAHICARHGRMDLAAARVYVAGLDRDGRYQRDVY
jgi:sulfite reductase (NADPH) flavoprotein alpha-component